MINLNAKYSAQFQKRQAYLPVIFFVLIAGILLAFNAFPALYGDEYDSLFDATHLLGNIHAIGYFFQLDLWHQLSNSDYFLRLLSILWFGCGLYWFFRWLLSEGLDKKTVYASVLLLVLNLLLCSFGLLHLASSCIPTETNLKEYILSCVRHTIGSNRSPV
jgi:hypothetical protein